MSPLARRAARVLADFAGLIVVAIVAIAAALLITPMQNVNVAGQVISVGTVPPGPSLSGPGQIDLFGEPLPTALRFAGPIRPRVALTQITLDSELANFVQGTDPGQATQRLGSALTRGWLRYFGWEAAIAGAATLLVTGAVAGWRRLGRWPTARLLAIALVLTEAANAGAVALAAHDTQQALRQVRSLNQLVGSDPIGAAPRRRAPEIRGVHVVVLGDSTAAGAGLAPLAGSSRLDRACGRSADSYAEDLAAANGWKVMNLACDSATISSGLLGSQSRSGTDLAPQLDSAARVRGAAAVIVSVGADDLQWALLLKYCAAAAHCNDRATTAYFRQKLAVFSAGYLQLLTRLAGLPGHPEIVINRYYNPFGTDLRCIAGRGLSAGNVATLTARLGTLNRVLAKGAAEFGAVSPKPDFAGHQLCSGQPYVQGIGDPAPFHPTAAGQLAIAIADERALVAPRPGTAAPGPSPAAVRPRPPGR